jgi:Domain of unknown function (DUF1942)
MKTKMLAGTVAVSAAMFGVAAVPPAWAAVNTQAFGIEETVATASGQIAYTVTKLLPSGDAVPYPINGQLYEASVMAKAVNGWVAPGVQFFSARSVGGQSYPVLAGVFTPQGLSGAPMPPTGGTSGKIYFDVVGEPPNSVVYNDGSSDLLSWVMFPGEYAPITGGGSTDGGTGGGAGGSQGVTGSTGPNEASPNTGGGDQGGGGIEGSDQGGGGLGGATGAGGGGLGGATGAGGGAVGGIG